MGDNRSRGFERESAVRVPVIQAIDLWPVLSKRFVVRMSLPCVTLTGREAQPTLAADGPAAIAGTALDGCGYGGCRFGISYMMLQ